MNIFDDNNLDVKINKLLNAIDPYGDKHIIFSDCVKNPMATIEYTKLHFVPTSDKSIAWLTNI